MKNPNHQSRVHRTSGFTLAEMLVVLAILAILTTVAVQSLVPIASEARYDATIRTLNNVSGAIVSVNQSSVSGFLADTGRLPGVVANNLGTDSAAVISQVAIEELTGVNPATGQVVSPPASDLAQFASATASIGGVSVTLPSGWNGPYLTPPAYSASTPTVYDGWGQTFNVSFNVPGAAIGYISVYSSGDPTASSGAQALTVSLPVASLQATSVTVTYVGAAKPQYAACIGPAPATNSAQVMPSGGLSASTVYNAATGLNLVTSSTAFSTSSPTNTAVMIVPTWTEPDATQLDGTRQLALIGLRAFVAFDANGNVVSGPVYAVLRPGANSVTLQ